MVARAPKASRLSSLLSTAGDSVAESDILLEIKDKLTSLEANAAKAKEAKNSGGMWGWLVALLVGAAVSIGAALLLWKLNKKNEELAKLRTQAEQDEVRNAQLKHEMSVSRPKARMAVLAAEAATVRVRLIQTKVKLEAEVKRHDEAMTRVIAARDWDQLDALNTGRKQ